MITSLHAATNGDYSECESEVWRRQNLAEREVSLDLLRITISLFPPSPSPLTPQGGELGESKTEKAVS